MSQKVFRGKWGGGFFAPLPGNYLVLAHEDVEELSSIVKTCVSLDEAKRLADERTYPTWREKLRSFLWEHSATVYDSEGAVVYEGKAREAVA